MMKLGFEVFLEKGHLNKWGHCCLVANEASLNASYQSSWQALHEVLGGNLVSMFSPQHGFFGVVQDNMIETDHGIHPPTGLPVYSLYSETREPTAKMLENVDTILIDLPLTGCRVYTFKYTLAACMRAAVKFDKKVVVLDRPNPLGGEWVEGTVLNPHCRSFVGEFQIPLRHGLTIAECARLFNEDIGCRLELVAMEGWLPNLGFNQDGRAWVASSPNLPTLDSVSFYPATVFFEGTNLSEGRGTALPFQLIGAPHITDPWQLVRRTRELLANRCLDVFVRPTLFQPTFHKFAGQTCGGVHLLRLPHRNEAVGPIVSLGISLARAFSESMAEHFSWKQPPYEYNHKDLPIRLIWGNESVDNKLVANDFDLGDSFWNQGVYQYIEKVRDYLMYPRKLRSPD